MRDVQNQAERAGLIKNRLEGYARLCPAAWKIHGHIHAVMEGASRFGEGVMRPVHGLERMSCHTEQEQDE